MKKLFINSAVILTTATTLSAATPTISSITPASSVITTVNAKKTSKTTKYAKLINKDITDNPDYGNMKFAWNKKHKAYEATVDPNSHLYESMDNGEVSIWNAFVGDVKEESQILGKHDRKYSAFQVINPDDKSRVFLQVAAGKVRYDISDDLK